MKTLSITVCLVLAASTAFAQTSDSLATPIGHEVNFSVGSYNYEEPGDLSISIHGAKFGGGYTGTMPLNTSHRWFLQLDGHGRYGDATYDGWCSPYIITPDSTSPNGWALDLGDPSRCSESGDKDWYGEVRGLVGKDFIHHTWAFSPDAGVGFRHLSNGTAGVDGFRTDDYLYIPLGVTARRKAGPHSTVSFSVEYDHLLHGWQNTYDSKLGGGDIPATPTTPPFTIEGSSDISFDQHDGWALRVSGKYQITPRWSVEPAYIHWNVSDSPVSDETISFTVHGVTAQEQFGAYEPANNTDEFVVRLGFHF